MTTKRGETAAIVPSETKAGRKEPMTMDEFWAELAKSRKGIEAAGKPLNDPTWREKNIRSVGVQG